jgi:hypothetical protein
MEWQLWSFWQVVVRGGLAFLFQRGVGECLYALHGRNLV